MRGMFIVKRKEEVKKWDEEKKKGAGGSRCNRGKEGKGDWVTLSPFASSSLVLSSAAGQVAGGCPTSADFSPFPLPLSHSFISCRHC